MIRQTTFCGKLRETQADNEWLYGVFTGINSMKCVLWPGSIARVHNIVMDKVIYYSLFHNYVELGHNFTLNSCIFLDICIYDHEHLHSNS